MINIAIDMRMVRHSGIGTYLRSLFPRLRALRPADRFCLLGLPERLQEQFGAPGAGVEHAPWQSPIYSVREQLRGPGCIGKGVDLLWSPHYNIPLLRRGPLVVTVHDTFHLAMPELVGGVHRRLYARVLFGAVAKKADAIICVSRFTADELVRLAGADARKIRVVPNGVDEAWFRLRRLRRPHSRPYLLFVGNVKPNKNLRRLVTAYESLAAGIEQDLVIVGQREGFLTADSQVAALAAKLPERVRFTGYVDQATLEQYFAHAEALVFPSLYEGFGLPPLEAMACGCPVIASRAASLPEVCGEAALYFDPREPAQIAAAIRRLVEDRGLRHELVHRGAERARAFSWDASAALTSEVFEEVCRG